MPSFVKARYQAGLFLLALALEGVPFVGEYLPKVARENGGFLPRSGAGETMRKLSG